MPKAIEVPVVLREFNKLFEQVANRWDWGQCYADFLSYATCFYTFPGLNEEWLSKRMDDAMRRYSKKEQALFPQMAGAMLEATATALHKSELGWTDQLGAYYEIISSSHKSKWLGQFFTPESLCTFTAMVTGNDIENALVNDPASGGGRLLLAHHALAPQHRCYYIAQDIDHMAADMAALNMVWHGLEGEVLQMDTLAMKFTRGWRINPWLYRLPIDQMPPCMVPIHLERDCYAMGGHPLNFLPWRDHARELQQAAEERKAAQAEAPLQMARSPTAAKEPKAKQTKPQFDSQLKLFDL